MAQLFQACHRRWNFLDKVPVIELPPAPKGRTRYLSEEEIVRLLQACARSRNRYLTSIVTLAPNTGMRKSEILGLTWERIELHKDMGFNARIVLHETKNNESRGIMLNAAGIGALTAIEPEPARRVGLVFKKRTSGEHWGQIRTAFEKAVERAGLPDFRFHDLRHSCASHLAMRGRPLTEIQQILGHKSFTMTLRYAHLSPTHLRTAIESLHGPTPDPAELDETAQEMAQSRSAEPTQKVTP
jgi:integrase